MKNAKWNIGEQVQVPYYCFSPYRRGWNGWLFANGTIVERRIGVGKNEGKKYAVVEYTANGKAERRQFRMENVFAR
jgi:hypothetical protein